MREAPCADAFNEFIEEYNLDLTPAQQLNLIGPGGSVSEPCGISSDFSERMIDAILEDETIPDDEKCEVVTFFIKPNDCESELVECLECT